MFSSIINLFGKTFLNHFIPFSLAFKCMHLIPCSDLRFMDLKLKLNQNHSLKLSRRGCSNAGYHKLIDLDFQEECTSFCSLECESNKFDFVLSFQILNMKIYSLILI